MAAKLEFHLYRKLHGASASIKRGDEYGNLEKILPGVSSMVIAGGGREAEPMGEHYYPVFLLDQDVKRES